EAVGEPKRRDEMANAAAPFVHARRAPEGAQGRTIPAMIYVTPTSRDSHSLDTYQSRDPRIKIAAQRTHHPAGIYAQGDKNIPPNSFAGLDWIRNRCGRSLERMGMIRIRRAYAQKLRTSAAATKHRMFHTDRTRYSKNPLPAKTLVGGFDTCQPAVRCVYLTRKATK